MTIQFTRTQWAILLTIGTAVLAACLCGSCMLFSAIPASTTNQTAVFVVATKSTIETPLPTSAVLPTPSSTQVPPSSTPTRVLTTVIPKLKATPSSTPRPNPTLARNHNLKLTSMRGVAASNGGVEAVKQTGASWYLNWSWKPDAGMPSQVEFVPMLPAALGQLPGVNAVAPSDYILGANEPNVAAQQNTCPADYVETWHAIIERWGDRKLVSPGVGSAGNISCQAPDGSKRDNISGADWLRDFRTFYTQKYGDPQWSVLSFHCYPPPESPCGDVRAATESIVALADKWNVAEVWVTEWDAGKGNGRNPARINEWIDYWLTVPKVRRIAYYQDYAMDAPNNSALTDSAGHLTEYGRVYRETR